VDARKGRRTAQPEDAHGSLGEVLDFMRVLWAVDHSLQSRSKRMGRELGVTGPQRVVIRLVGRFPGISAGELADLLHLHPSTLTGILSRLLDRELVSRDSDPLDARRALFKLTAEGRKLDQTKTGTVEAAVRKAIAKVPASRLEAAREVLEHIAESLGGEPEA
jgi:DNA-binding MarR family transcriptional regulator